MFFSLQKQAGPNASDMWCPRLGTCLPRIHVHMKHSPHGRESQLPPEQRMTSSTGDRWTGGHLSSVPFSCTTQAHTHVLILTCIHAHVYTMHIHADADSHAHVCAPLCAHTCAHSHACTCIHVCIHVHAHTCTCSHTYAHPKLLELVLVWAELCQLDLSGKDVLQGERREDKRASYAQREKNESSRTQWHVTMQWWEPTMKGLGRLPKKYWLQLQHFKESSIGKLVTHSAFRIIETREERIDSRGI